MRDCARSYPVSAIDEGIKNCIRNSRNLLASARLLFVNHLFEHSFLLYTFAEEEFGKGLLLQDKRKVAMSKGEDLVSNDDITFCNHRRKLERAESHDPALGVRMIDDSMIPVIDAADLLNPSDPSVQEKFRFGGRDDFQYEREVYSKLERRFSFLYVDYDEGLSQWHVEPFRPSQLELGFAYDALRDNLNELESQLAEQEEPK